MDLLSSSRGVVLDVLEESDKGEELERNKHMYKISDAITNLRAYLEYPFHCNLTPYVYESILQAVIY